MISNNANYDMDTAIKEASLQGALIDLKVETQVILQILVANGLTTKEEIDSMRSKIKNSSKYKAIYESINNIVEKAEYYKNNPEQHLKDLLQMKMDGKL